MSSLLRLERKRKNSSNLFRILIFFFLSYRFGIETPRPQKPYPIPDQNGQSVYPFSDQNGAKTLPDGAAHAYIAYIRENSPGSNVSHAGTMMYLIYKNVVRRA